MTFRESGIIVIDKPQGVTSHDVVAAIRKKLGTKKVGHAGTLDPMATGVLVLGVNQATRLLDFIVAGAKEYEATIRFGQSTISDDADGEVVETADASHLTDEQVRAALLKNLGKISQLPSKVSAKKIDGKRAHALVREGVEFELKPKEVEIFELEIKQIVRVAEFLDVNIRVKCTAGTYIRSIARDTGTDLKVGGHLTALRRTLVAPFSIESAQEITADLNLIGLYDATKGVLQVTEVEAEIAKEITFGKPLKSEVVRFHGLSAITHLNQVMAIVEKTDSAELSYRAVITTELAD